MNYTVSDVETAAIPAGEAPEFRFSHSDQSMASLLDIQALDRMMNPASVAYMSVRNIEQVMDAVPQHMFILEADATLSFVNRAAREYLGPIEITTPTERLRAIIHPDDSDALLGVYRDAMAHGISIEAEARVRSKTGQYRWFLHQLFPLRDEHERIVRWCGTRI